MEGTLIYLVFNYVEGNDSLTLKVQDNPIGYAKTNPLHISQFNSFSIIDDKLSAPFYITIDTKYVSRIINISTTSMSNDTVSILYQNGTLLKELSLNGNTTSLEYILPLDLKVSEITQYNPFETYELIFSSSLSESMFNISVLNLKPPRLTYIGPNTFTENVNNSLELAYTGNDPFTYSISINNSSYLTRYYDNDISNSIVLSISITNLTAGFYVVDIKIIDTNGLLAYQQFSFTITPSEPPITSSRSSTTATNLLTSQTILGIIGLLSLVVVLGVGTTIYDRTHSNKIKNYIKNRFKNK